MLSALQPGPSAHEERLREAVARGEIADFSADDPPPAIRAEVVRRLLLGLPFDPSRDPPGRPPTAGVRLIGARIVGGGLDLGDASGGEASSLPTLALEACVFDEPIVLDDLHVRRLSLKGSRFLRLSARGLRSDGRVDVSDVASSASIRGDTEAPEAADEAAPGDPPPCEVDLSGARLDGGLVAARAVLAADLSGTLPSRGDPSSTGASYALHLRAAVLRGDLLLQPGFAAVGGVDLQNATVHGDVWAEGADLRGRDQNGLRAQGLRVTGNVALRRAASPDGTVRPFRAEGGPRAAAAGDAPGTDVTPGTGEAAEPGRHESVWLWGATIEGKVEIAGAALLGDLVVRSARLGTLEITDTTLEGEAWLDDTRVDGGLQIDGVAADGELVRGDSHQRGDLVLSNTHVGGDLDIGGATSCPGKSRGTFRFGKIFLRSAAVGGSLQLMDGEADGLYADDLTVGDDLYLCSRSGLGRCTNARPGLASGDPALDEDRLELQVVWMQEARIGGSLFVDGAVLGPLVHLDRADIGGLFALGASRIDGPFLMPESRIGGSVILRSVLSRLGRDAPVARPALDLANCRIAGDLELTNGTELHAPVHAPGSTVGGSLALEDARILGGSSFEGMNVRGSVRLHRVVLGNRLQPGPSGPGTSGDLADHSLRNMTVGEQLAVEGVVAGIRHLPSVAADTGAPEDGSRAAAWRLRRRPLACYPGWSLVEAIDALDGGGDGQAEASGSRIYAALWAPCSGSARGQFWPLDGSSASIHSFNDRVPPDLSSEEAVRDYLELFCGYLWAQDGPFRVIASTDDLPRREGAALPTVDLREPQITLLGWFFRRRGAEATATVLYGGQLFRASFRIHPGGMVEMQDDEPLATLPGGAGPAERLEAPARIREGPDGALAPPGMPGPGWEEIEEGSDAHAELAAGFRRLDSGDAWAAAYHTLRRLGSPPVIDLSASSVDWLNDADGAAWGEDVRFKLDGFRYTRAPRGWLWKEPTLDASSAASVGPEPPASVGPTDQAEEPGLLARLLGRAAAALERRRLPGRFPRVKRRLRWLELQQEATARAEDTRDYRPYPYEVLAAALRNEGALDESRAVLSRKLTLESRQRSFGARLFWWPYRVCFDYGLSPRRALFTCLGLWLIGTLGVHYANSHDLLVVNYTPASTAVVERLEASGRRSAHFALPPERPDAERPLTEIPCGDVIQEPVYALDLMIPILDFHQESACVVREPGSGRGPSSPAGGVRAGADADLTAAAAGLPADPTGPAAGPGPRVVQAWALARTVYTILGAIVVSLAILTWSGLARRQVEA